MRPVAPAVVVLAASLAASLAACGGPKPTPTGPTAGSNADAAAPTPTSDAGVDATGGAVTEAITADSPRTTAAGAAFTAPAGWSLTASGAITRLAAQDGDSWIAIVDAAATEPDAAVAEAWTTYRSDAAPPLKLGVDTPAREGWDQERQYTYEIPPNAKRIAFAFALRKDAGWTVVVVDASEPTFGKRNPQFRLVRASLRPRGYTRESFAGKTANQLDAARLAKLDELIELGRDQLGIPGVAIAVVQDGKVIHAKGFGVRELGKKQAVDANTLFMIASNTKALTTLLLALAVDDGKLAWDQPVTEVYPDFKLGDAATTAATEVRHLVCACTGLPRKDFVWLYEFSAATAVSEMAYLAQLQPTTKFGEAFQYSNLLAGAAGFVAAHVLAPDQELGKAYDAAMKARVFTPLGMKSTTFDYGKALRGNHAAPHGWDIDGAPAVSAMDIDYSAFPQRPAVGAWSSANDFIKYVQLELDKGVAAGGKRVVSEVNLLRRREPYVSMGEDRAYGMGLIIETNYGIPVIHHGGSLIGFKSDMVWLPDHGVGAVILTNSELGVDLLGPFRRYLLELLFDGNPEAVEDLKAAAAAERAAVTTERPHLTVPAEAAAVAALAKHYTSAELGPLAVTTRKHVTTFDVGEWKSAVASRKNDDGTMSFVPTGPGLATFEYVVGTADGKRTLTVREAQVDYVFVED